MTRARAIAHGEQYFDSGQLHSDLAHPVVYRRESQTNAPAPVLWHYLRQAIEPRPAAMGFANQNQDIAGTGVKGGPVLLATRIKGAVLTSGHGDVIRWQDCAWRPGLTPFVLIDAGERLYGRGSADNRVPHLINIAALESVLAVGGRLGVNVNFVL